VACFFSSVPSTPTIAGISGGVAAGIAIAAICAAIVAFWLSKKGYDYYRAAADANAAGLHSNPYYQENVHAGDMPTLTSRN